MSAPTIAVLSPGAMGSALGRSWRAGGARLITTVAGRSDRTRGLAHHPEPRPWSPTSTPSPRRPRPQSPRCSAGPAAATSTGRSPGGPPTEGGDTVLFLYGPDCSPFVDLRGPGLTPRVVGATVGAASAAKMSTAAIYKGAKALLLQSLAAAAHHGVLDAVVTDLTRALPDVMADPSRDIAVAVAKGDRFPSEIREIAATQVAAGLPGELYEAVAIVYERAHESGLGRRRPEEAARSADLARVLADLAAR